jgi:hypothetical protein
MTSTVEEISRLEKDLLACIESNNIDRIKDIISIADQIEMTTTLLKATNIAKVFQKLRKFSSEDIAQTASAVISKWKQTFRNELGEGFPTTPSTPFASTSTSKNESNFKDMHIHDFLTLDMSLSKLQDRSFRPFGDIISRKTTTSPASTYCNPGRCRVLKTGIIHA